MKWRKYSDLEPHRRLRNEGRELLCKEILMTEKRDGENVSVWLDDDEIRISSHNLEKADDNITARMKETPEFSRIVDFLRNERTYNHEFIVYGELLKRVSPTRIERKRKHCHWILFDMWDIKNERFIDYSLLYQHAYHFRIPIVKVLDTIMVKDLDELKFEINKALKWCKRHNREGIVGKCYHEQIMFKEKIDLPKIIRIPRTDKKPKLPPMPEEKILRALQHAWDEINDEEKWKDKSIAMPVIARQISAEAREHNFEMPDEIFKIYIETPLNKIKRQNDGQ